MRSALDDPAVIQHDDDVGVLDRGQSVRDDEDRASFHERVHTALYDGFCTRVDGGSRLVQDHDRRICHSSSCDGKQLALSLGQVRAVSGQHGVVAFRKTGDEVVRSRELCRADAFLVGSVQFSVADVFHDGAGEEVYVLEHDPQRVAQIVLFDLVDVDPVVADLSVLDVVETVEQIRDGRFARACRADEGDLLSRFCVQRDILQNGFVRHIGEIHVEQADVAAKGSVGDGLVCTVRMFPRPFPGRFFRFGERAVFRFVHVDQRHVSFVCFRLLIHQLEDAARSGKPHDDGIDLVGDLSDVSAELLGHVEEGYDDADPKRQTGDAHVLHMCGEEDAAGHGNDHVKDVSRVVQDGAEDVCVLVRFVGGIVQFVVDGVEIPLALLFMVEDLDHFLAGHHFFREPFDLSEFFLTRDKVAGGASADLLGDQHDREEAHQHDQRHPDAVVQHDEEDGEDRDRRDQQLRETLGDHLPQRIDIVGIVAHDIAVLMLVEVGDRKLLHIVEEPHAQFFERSLRNGRHQEMKGQTGGEREDIQRHERADILQDRSFCGCPVACLPGRLDHGDDTLHEHGRDR